MTKENNFSKLIKDQLAKDTEVKNIGEVVKVGDGVAKVSGLAKVGINELVYFEKAKVYGIAFNIEADSLGIVVLGSDENISEGDVVSATLSLPTVPVGKALSTRVVNALGVPIDNSGPIEAENRNAIERKAPGVLDRKPVYRPIQTGIKIIDAVIPVGRGQRELIIGDRKTGKTSIIADTIISQSRINQKIIKKEQEGKIVYSIYCAIGQKASSVANFITKLKNANAFDHTIIVYSSPDESPAMQYLAPYSATAIGEYFMDNGMDAVVFYDDLTKHAWAYRQMSLLLNRFPGREAYPGDIFYLHSRLLERSAQLSDELGGGSLTSFPVIETLDGDVSAYIPTNVISITDGQIYLDTDYFNSDIKPAINAGTSVSRVGSAAQIKAIKKISGKLRLLLAQYRELAAFAQFGSDLDKETLSKLERGERITEILKQNVGQPLEVEKQVVIIYAVSNGYLDNIPVDKIKKWEKDLLEFIEVNSPELLNSIIEKKELTPEIEDSIKHLLTNFNTGYV